MPEYETHDEAVADAFHRSVEEGDHRTSRSWPALLATGMVGGLDVGIGIFAALVVLDATGSRTLAALAFVLGFWALVLAGSELFTENFLVPVMAATAGRASLYDLLRLWGGTLVANLVGGWIVMGLVMAAFAHLGDDAIRTAQHYPALGLGWTAMAAAILAGMVITVMTWMERHTQDTVGKLVGATVAAFPLFAGPLVHTVVVAHEMFAALHVGAPFGYLDTASAVGWAIIGNILGGVGLVTVLRLVQVGAGPIRDSRETAG